jgi:hypothetical protein
MALPIDFMHRVVAWPGEGDPGHVNVHYTMANGIRGMPGKPFRDVHSFMSYVQAITASPNIKDIYFCLSTQSKTGISKTSGKVNAVRLKDNALALKAIWSDIDVKPEKGYATLGAAIGALTGFCKAAGLPPPSALVGSGGGLHVYWINDSPLSVAEWEPFAFGLRDLAIKHGLRCDVGLTTDAARVLRIPGTFNRKETKPRVVRLLHLGTSYSFDIDLAAVKVLGAPLVTAAVKAVPAPLGAFAGYVVPSELATLDPKETLSAGIERKIDLPLKLDGLMQCPHFKEALITGGKDFPQGLWMQDVLASTWFDKPRPLAHAISKGHKGYSIPECNAMFDRKVKDREGGLGWPSCHAFENDGCKLCTTCVYKGKINSPLNLCTRVDPPPVDTLPPPMVADKIAEQNGAEPDDDEYDLQLPAGYQLNNEGCICIRVEVEDERGTMQSDTVPLFQFRVSKPRLTAGASPSMQMMVEVGKDGLLELNIPQAAFGNLADLVRAMTINFCLIDQRGKKYLEAFMSLWFRELVKAEARVLMQPYGWLQKKEGGNEPVGFCYGGTLFKCDGNKGLAGHADNEIKEAYSPRGSIEPWYRLLSIITAQHAPALEALLLAGFAGSIFYATGEIAAIFWAHSGLSGAHKTTSLETGQAIWANPPRAKVQIAGSQVAIANRLGTLKEITGIFDEVRTDEDIEAMVRLSGPITEGSTAPKMERNGVKSRPTKQWNTLVTVGSNQDPRMKQLIVDSRNTDAGVKRYFVVEVPLGKDTHDQHEVAMLRASLAQNYGQMGLLYARYISTRRSEIETSVTWWKKDIERRFKTNSTERFWLAITASILASAEIVNDMLVADGREAAFHIDEIYDYFEVKWKDQRNWVMRYVNVGGTPESAYEVTNNFLNSTLKHQLWTANQQMGRGRPSIMILRQYMGIVPEDVWIRWVRDDRVLQISKKRFEEWLQQTKANLNVISGLEQHYGAKLRNKIQLTTGLKDRGMGREQIIEMPIPEGHDWEANLLACMELQPTDPTPTGILEKAETQAAKDLALVKATTA